MWRMTASHSKADQACAEAFGLAEIGEKLNPEQILPLESSRKALSLDIGGDRSVVNLAWFLREVYNMFIANILMAARDRWGEGLDIFPPSPRDAHLWAVPHYFSPPSHLLILPA